MFYNVIKLYIYLIELIIVMWDFILKCILRNCLLNFLIKNLGMLKLEIFYNFMWVFC